MVRNIWRGHDGAIKAKVALLYIFSKKWTKRDKF